VLVWGKENKICVPSNTPSDTCLEIVFSTSFCPGYALYSEHCEEGGVSSDASPAIKCFPTLKVLVLGWLRVEFRSPEQIGPYGTALDVNV